MTRRKKKTAHAGRRLWLAGLAWGMGLVLGGCTLGPDYVRPGVEAPEAYQEMQGWKVAQPRAEAPAQAWWLVFNDPQLNNLQAQVELNNQNLAAAQARLAQARAILASSRAGLFPSLNLAPSHTALLKSKNTASSSGGGVEYTDYNLPLQFSWEIDLWGKLRRNLEANQASAQASAGDLAAARLSAQADLAQSYFQMRALDAQKKLLDQTVESYRQSLELTQRRHAGGVVSLADVSQAQAQLRSAQAQAIDLGIQRAQLVHAMALLTGRPPAALSLGLDPLELPPPPVPVGLPSELLERRPDVAAAERRVAAANAQIGVGQAAFFPNLTLSASAGYESASLANWLEWPSRFWSVGPSISQAVFDGGLRRAQSQGYQAAYELTVASYRQTVLTAFKEVEDNLAALRLLEEEAQVQAQAVAAGRQSLAIANNQYKAGTVGYLNVLVAQNSLLTLERSAVEILGRRLTASVLLIKALGGGWQGIKSELAQAEPPALSPPAAQQVSWPGQSEPEQPGPAQAIETGDGQSQP